jgi:hypothetical protein
MSVGANALRYALSKEKPAYPEFRFEQDGQSAAKPIKNGFNPKKKPSGSY